MHYFTFRLLIFLFVLRNVFGGCRSSNEETCESICYTKNGNTICELRALVLLPKNNFFEVSLDKVTPVINVAENVVYSSKLLPSFLKINWSLQDSKCDSSIALVNAMDGISKNCSHVIFGPLCDYPLGKHS